MKKLITNTIITCYLAALPMLGLAADSEPSHQGGRLEPESKANEATVRSKSDKDNKDTPKVEVISVDVGNQITNDDNKAGKTSRVERIVMPFTQWVEERVQNTSIVKPSVIPNKNKHQKLKGITLREAIERARIEHKGTVLSAERIEEKNNLIYRIKIISQDGVIKTIEINGIAHNQDSEK